jgi:hypothetical protein
MRVSEQPVQVDWYLSETRTVHTTKKHPQIGWVWFEGEKHPVYVGFSNDIPVWKSPDYLGNQEEYDYCAERTVPIEQDPDYIGETSS